MAAFLTAVLSTVEPLADTVEGPFCRNRNPASFPECLDCWCIEREKRHAGNHHCGNGHSWHPATQHAEPSALPPQVFPPTELPDHPDLHIPFPHVLNLQTFGRVESYHIDLLLMVVTQVEFLAVLRHFKPLQGHAAVLRGNPDQDDYLLGVFGVYRCALVQCDMGSDGAGGSTLVAQRAITFWKPKAAIMIGIGFGLQPKKQNYGDVLVSHQLASYDLRRVTGDSMEITRRGFIQPSGQHLSPRFMPASIFDWSFEGRQVWRGQVLSGDALVDSRPFAEALLHAYPEAVGGEMEGHGVSASAFATGTQWIVVKGICDFAGLSGGKNKTAQAFAAASAVSLVLHVFSRHCLAGLGCRCELEFQEEEVLSSIAFSTPSSSGSELRAPMKNNFRFFQIVTQLRVSPSVAAWLQYLEQFLQARPPDGQHPVDYLRDLGELTPKVLAPTLKAWLEQSYRMNLGVIALFDYFNVK